MATAPQLQRNQKIRVKITDLAFGGQGIAKLQPDNFVVFVNGGLPGDDAEVRIVKRKKTHAEADIVEIHTPSPKRIEAPCKHFKECGGCTYQHLDYLEQLKYKQRQVDDTLRRISKIHGLPEPEMILAAPDQYHYRNKMDYTIGKMSDGQTIGIGFHKKNEWRSTLDVDSCLLHPPEYDALLKVVRDFARDSGLEAFDRKTHEGFWRHLLVRKSAATGESVAVVITKYRGNFDFTELAEKVRQACPKMKGFAWGLNDRMSDVAIADELREQWGEMELLEKLGDKKFRVSPFSFFQTNTQSAILLYDTVREFIELEPHHHLLDAYCGTGSIGIYCADLCERVWGIESEQAAIWDARHNARLNNLENTTFLAGLVRRTLPLVKQQAKGFDRMVVDPPRSGMHKKALEGLLNLNVPQFVYVSCNPATMARDLQAIDAAGYRAQRIRPVDQFPQTYHIEVVIQFKKI